MISYAFRRIPNPRSALVTMASTLASFGTALLLRTVSGQSVSLVILAVVLSLSLSRLPGHGGWRRSVVTLVLVPIVGIAAVSMGQLLQQHFVVGAAVLTLTIGASFLLRQFSWWLALTGQLLLLPATAILVVPAVGFNAGGDGRWWVMAVAVMALVWVTIIRRLASWTGFVPHKVTFPKVPAQGITPSLRSGQSRMALWMCLSLSLAFVLGRALFPAHWNWTVLTAIIVGGSGPSRGEVALKGVTRLIGAGAGTLIATLVAAGLPGHHDGTVAIIFAVLFVGTWWREVHYAVWAAGATCVMALLNSYFGSFGSTMLTSRLLAIAIGAACSVAVCSLVFPIPTDRIVRLRRGRVLAALQDLAQAMATPGADLGRAHHDLELRAMELQESLRPFRWRQMALGHLWPPDEVLMSTTKGVLGCVEPASGALLHVEARSDDPSFGDSALAVARHITAVRKRLAGRSEIGHVTPADVHEGLAQFNQAVLAIP